ncbi:dihydrodipicolinate synthase family protein [Sphaerobacter thermophilus]|jgi:4-hydroxy-tetrahydrodipicolinate synthase|uniref:dihydrodipicolinate synthase family protein n=1 Tax=Sphaerobacter thermophilus TaxID=2057 RepID=UPI0023572678
MSERTARYPGVYAAMATPLTPDGKVDRDGVGRLVNALLDAGIDGLSILGSTGECNGLTRAQRQEVLATVMEAAGGRGTIFTGAAGTVVDDIVADLKAADGSGAVGALVPPPFYFPLNTAAVIDYFQYVAEASPIPIILYNIPRLTKVPIAVEAVARLAEHPNIIGIKDSSGDFGYFTAVVRAVANHPDFTVLTGSDNLLASALFAGGDGIIGATVNVVPEAEAGIFKAMREGDFATAQSLQGLVAAVTDACRIGVFPAAFKAALALKGICGPHMTRPIPALTDEETAELRSRLVALGVIEA